MNHGQYYVGTLEHQRLDVPLKNPVGSLCWAGDALVDWAGGNRVIHLDGRDLGSRVIWGFRFDAAVQSPTGRYAAIYERLGTKAVLMDRGRVLRELNRSYYFANTYEYPIVFFTHPDGRELIAHCPENYNQIEIDEVATGNRLTAGIEREPADFFHSRLAVSPDGTRLLSAGWIWHPFNSVSTWRITDALADARDLDKLNPSDGAVCVEINDAAFIDSDRILVSSSPEAQDLSEDERGEFGPGHLGILNPATSEIVSLSKVEETLGRMLWLGDGRVLGLYETPKVLDMRTGKVIHRWPDIVTGKQDSSIISHLDSLPTIAVDPVGRRVAVAVPDRISVLLFP